MLRILIVDDQPVARDGLSASVKAHVLHMYAKLGVNDRAAVATAYERGLLTPAASGTD